MQSEALATAVRLLGGTVAAARALDLNTYQALQQWRKNGVPPVSRAAIERVTEGRVPVEAFGNDVKWRRIRDKEWPWNGGRPLHDVTAEAA